MTVTAVRASIRWGPPSFLRPSFRTKLEGSRRGTASSRSSSTASSSADAAGPSVTPSEKESAEATFQRLFLRGDSRPIVLFDGICVWCNTNVDLVARLDRNRQLRFAALQSPVGRDLLVVCGRAPDDLSSMVVVDSSRRFHLKSDAVLRIAEAIAPFPWLGSSVKGLASFLMPKFIRDSAYDVMGDNRYSLMGKRDTCRLPDPDDNRFVE